MKYVSIDIETTGIDPERHQVIEFGAVIDDTKNPKALENLPKFHRIVKHSEICGSAVALAMNERVIRLLAEESMSGRASSKTICGSGVSLDERVVRSLAEESMSGKATLETICHPSSLGPQFRSWLITCGVNPDRVWAAGKNFGAFDYAFLRRMPPFCGYIKFKHRFLDPGPMYFDPQKDDEIPSLCTCIERAGLTNWTLHNAVGDAINVIRVMRAHWTSSEKERQ